ncbi:DUF975 family protein [Oscillospiraceae bacterium MB08-C2-2]|nr:DUF975 family protein [Oscillospiraceae bacterium MB08-C2-2]
MSLFRVFKKNARLALQDSWGRALGILLLVMGIGVLLGTIQGITSAILAVSSMPALDSFSFSFSSPMELFAVIPWVYLAVPGAFGLLNFLLVVPLGLGQIRWYHQLVHDQSEPISNVFHYYEGAGKYFRCLWYYISLTIRQSLWAVLFLCIPMGAMALSVVPLMNEEVTRIQASLSTFGLLISCVLLILATILYTVHMMKYFLTPYLMAEDPKMSVGKAIRTSIRFTKGYRFSLFSFSLSFLGWILLCIFLFPILFVGPYLQTSMALYARYIIEKNQSAIPAPTKEFKAVEIIRDEEPVMDLWPAQPHPPTAPSLEPDLFEEAPLEAFAEEAAQPTPEPDEPSVEELAPQEEPPHPEEDV